MKADDNCVEIKRNEIKFHYLSLDL